MTHLPHNETGAILPNIAFVGKAGAGKSSAADILCDHYFYTRTSLAGPLKEIAARLWGPDGGSDRGKLQQLGVAVRTIQPDTWVQLLIAELVAVERDPLGRGFANRWCVDDVRFPNEYEQLRAHGFVVVKIQAKTSTRVDRLKRNGKWQNEAQLNHESETSLDGPEYPADYVIENDESPDALLNGLLNVLNKERR